MSQKTYVVTLSLVGSKSVNIEAESEDEACAKAFEDSEQWDILDDLRDAGFDATIEVGSVYERVK